MKRIISLILALVMVASLGVLAVSADDTNNLEKAVAGTIYGNMQTEGGVFYTTKGEASYTIGQADAFELEAKIEREEGAENFGFFIAGTDKNGDNALSVWGGTKETNYRSGDNFVSVRFNATDATWVGVYNDACTKNGKDPDWAASGGSSKKDGNKALADSYYVKIVYNRADRTLEVYTRATETDEWASVLQWNNNNYCTITDGVATFSDSVNLGNLVAISSFDNKAKISDVKFTTILPALAKNTEYAVYAQKNAGKDVRFLLQAKESFLASYQALGMTLGDKKFEFGTTAYKTMTDGTKDTNGNKLPVEYRYRAEGSDDYLLVLVVEEVAKGEYTPALYGKQNGSWGTTAIKEYNKVTFN